MARATKTIAQPVAETPKQNRTFPVIVVLAVLLLLAVGIAGYFYYQYRSAQPGVAEAKEIKQLTETIGSFMVLPEGEEPTLATVTDKEKLAEQPFFQKAENGDKVLIYTNSGRAILYRPNMKKIVDVTKVNVQPTEVTAATPTTSETVSAPASTSEIATPQDNGTTITLYNGSTKIGVTNTLEDEIKTKFPDVEVVTKDKAVKNDYQGNLVVDLSGNNADLAKKLATSFGGTVGALPVGETAPTTDLLIIVGNK